MTSNCIKSENTPVYGKPTSEEGMGVSKELLQSEIDQSIITQAQKIIKRRLTKPSDPLTCMTLTSQYFQVLLAECEYEIFGVLMLDNLHRPIVFREMFRGTINGASVYPREVVKQALLDNATSVVLCHNHPSGITEPSRADRDITARLKTALQLVDINILDHFIVGATTTSFAERGIL